MACNTKTGTSNHGRLNRQRISGTELGKLGSKPIFPLETREFQSEAASYSKSWQRNPKAVGSGKRVHAEATSATEAWWCHAETEGFAWTRFRPHATSNAKTTTPCGEADLCTQ
mmetsp:Transcript_32623/g.101668  ORF Transcript_32623/g.101668 Transcript_32623/m.101668 type:complete len:113 (+) Transcript_32623:549-887(+)